MNKCLFVDRFVSSDKASHDELIEDIVMYLKSGEIGTLIIPFDDMEHVSLEDFRYRLRGDIRDALMLPSYGVVHKLVKTNNISATYGCSVDTAISIMNMKGDSPK